MDISFALSTREYLCLRHSAVIAADRGALRSACADLDLIYVAPNTNSFGRTMPDDAKNAYEFGSDVGFCIEATETPLASDLAGVSPTE